MKIYLGYSAEFGVGSVECRSIITETLITGCGTSPCGGYVKDNVCKLMLIVFWCMSNNVNRIKIDIINDYKNKIILA